MRWASQGQRDPVGAHALVLEVPGARVGVVSAEILLVTEPLLRRVEALVADLRLDAVILGASHTHAGPGGYWDDVVAEHSALGPYDAANLERLAVGVAGALREAAAGLTPATLAVARGSAVALVWARSRGRVDGGLLSLRLTGTDGRPIGELAVFAAHPTTLGKANRQISGDWPGRFMRAPGRGVRLLLQGAVGDQSAAVPPGGEATKPERYAANLLAADDALVASTPAPETTIAVASASVTLPALALGAVPGPLRPAASTLAWGRMPSTARLTALRLGPALLLAVPAEPTAEIGARWRSAAGPDTAVVSLADGWIGYVDDAGRVRRGEGEAPRTYYGPALAERLEAGLDAAVRALGDAQRP